MNEFNPSEFLYREMTPEDLPDVMKVEQLSFTTPWSEQSFLSELLYNEVAHYFVLEVRGLVMAYAGIWSVVGEGHITNIAVHPRFRGLGLGRLLVSRLMESAKELGCGRITLEVRPSNAAAIGLYESFGFRTAGVRKGYYQDTGEDALIMWRE